VMRELEHVRRRDGAYAWSLYSDPEQPGHMLETFLVSSWAEHMRQHHRGSVADVALEQRVRAFHLGTGPIIVHHYLAQSMARIR
jgi:hypothetical protein